MTMTASTAATVTLWEPKPARKSEREKIETTTMIAIAATAPKACTKSARASWIPRRKPLHSERPSMRMLGTERPIKANQPSATK